MILRCALLVLIFALVTPCFLTAQVGWRDESFTNPTTAGSAALLARVYYPGMSNGQGAPLAPKAGGHPVVVVLHGSGSLGRDYPDLGLRLASEGFVVVLSDTAMSQPGLQYDDGVALYSALKAENASGTSFWHRELDIGRMAICGHSMGGGSVVRILSDHIGYRTGICLAPWNGIGLGGPGTYYPSLYAPWVKVPLLLIHGEGDTVLPWQSSALPFYGQALAYSETKAFVLLDSDCTHSNLARLTPASSNVDKLVFDRSMDTTVGWLNAHLLERPDGFEEIVGPGLLHHPKLTSLQSEVKFSSLWAIGKARLGDTVNIRLGGEPGAALLYASFGRATIPTPLGTILLDPVTAFVINAGPIPSSGPQLTSVVIPNIQGLVGGRIWLQGIAQTDGLGPIFSNRIEVVFEP